MPIKLSRLMCADQEVVHHCSCGIQFSHLNKDSDTLSIHKIATNKVRLIDSWFSKNASLSSTVEF